MFIFQVHHFIKPEMIEVYKNATLENARKTVLEPGILRFDFFQDAQDPAHFSLFEIYRDDAAREAHLQTEHFDRWKDVYLEAKDPSRPGYGHTFEALFPPEADWG